VSFLSDLRVALRTLVRAPAFFAMSTGVLALGIAAVVVMFGFLRATARPPPLDRVDRVFALPVADVRHGELERPVQLQDVQDWSREQRSFDGLAGLGPETVSFRREGATAVRCLAARVTGPAFGILRVRPLLGRILTDDDARAGASPVVVISEHLWRAEFRADPSAIGESIRLNGEPYTVVGVAPAALDLPVSALLWFADVTNTGFDPNFTSGLGPMPRLLSPTLFPIGRLRDGVTIEAARAELRVIQSRRTARYPEVANEIPDIRPLSTLWMGAQYLRLFRVLFGSVLLVLALACVNVAGLLLVRGAGRTHEAAIRRSLGAGRLRLASQMLGEAAVIGAAAAVVAVTLAEATMELLRRVVPAVLPTSPGWWRMRLDAPTLLFALGVAVVAALGAGLYPAIRATRISVDPLLREGQRDTGLHSTRLVRWLVVAEIALSAALLTAAGLVTRSASRLGRGDVGVPTGGFLMARVELPQRYDFRMQVQFAHGLAMRARALPGVEAAAISTSAPGTMAFWRPLYQLADRSAGRMEELPSAAVVLASPGFFESFGIPVKGRTFLDTDQDARSTVGVVSESMARAAWPGENPVGKVIRIAPQEAWIPPVTVIGVAKDVSFDNRLSAEGNWPPVIYVSAFQWPSRWYYLTMRAPRDPLAAAEGVRQAVRELDFEVPVFSVRSLDDERQRNAAGLTLIGRMFAVFGGVALALAAAGVYGVLAYSVAQGSREIGIRRALGAPGGRIVLAVMARSGWQLALGLLLGMVLAPAVRAVVGTVLGQAESGLQVYLGVAAVLSVTLLVSVAVPLRRALSLQPSAALRHT